MSEHSRDRAVEVLTLTCGTQVIREQGTGDRGQGAGNRGQGAERRRPVHAVHDVHAVRHPAHPALRQEERQEHLAVEVPYTVYLNDRKIGASMVLATGLEEFGAGFLFGQGHVRTVGQVREVLVCPDGRITVHADVDEEEEPGEVIITSGCGGTGRISRDMLEGAFEPLADYQLPFAEIGPFIQAALSASPLGPLTHCVHGCGFWTGGRLAAFYEDVGRHNAVDKVIGAILLGRIPRAGAVYTTGRLTSDMVLKCARMGIPVVMSRTAPSSLGLAIARRAGLTLVGYSRPGRINVFHAPERILA